MIIALDDGEVSSFKKAYRESGDSINDGWKIIEKAMCEVLKSRGIVGRPVNVTVTCESWGYIYELHYEQA